MMDFIITQATTMADGPVEALELVKTVSCVECFLTSTAWAERVEE